MLPLFGLEGAPLAKSFAVGLIATSLVSNNPAVPQPQQQTPILEVIKIYGKLAGQECYGSKAPQGSSCQITMAGIKQKLNFDHDDNTKSTIDQNEFRDLIDGLDFQWPLKPFGLDKSLSKTATMNKGAETRVFMEELEHYGLYDPRNPTGPLPTSLRPKLNTLLQNEGVDSAISEKVFQALGGKNGKLDFEQLQHTFNSDIDYYGFLELIGKETIIWPY